MKLHRSQESSSTQVCSSSEDSWDNTGAGDVVEDLEADESSKSMDVENASFTDSVRFEHGSVAGSEDVEEVDITGVSVIEPVDTTESVGDGGEAAVDAGEVDVGAVDAEAAV